MSSGLSTSENGSFHGAPSCEQLSTGNILYAYIHIILYTYVDKKLDALNCMFNCILFILIVCWMSFKCKII